MNLNPFYPRMIELKAIHTKIKSTWTFNSFISQQKTRRTFGVTTADNCLLKIK